jgi:hypothetical protein
MMKKKTDSKHYGWCSDITVCCYALLLSNRPIGSQNQPKPQTPGFLTDSKGFLTDSKHYGWGLGFDDISQNLDFSHFFRNPPERLNQSDTKTEHFRPKEPNNENRIVSAVQ